MTLNEIVGGVDRDSNLIANRNAADTAALDVAYRSGIVMDGKNHAKHAEIDMRGYDDSLIPAVPLAAGSFLTGIHHVWRSFAIRDRLDRDAGGHDNQVMWRFGLSGFIVPPGTMASDAFLTMDKWMTNLKADTSTAAIEQKVKSSKLAEAFDYCVLSTDATQSTKVTDKAICDADPLLNPESSPRQVAGGPRAEDVLKCQLKAIDPAEYAPATLTGGQLGRLQAVFPTGVCDWSKPGVSQQAAVSPLTFKSGPGGQPLPQAPSAVAAE